MARIRRRFPHCRFRAVLPLAEGASAGNETVVFSGASGAHDATAREKAWLDQRFAGSAVRGYSAVIGQSLEAQFPLGLSLAALTLGAGVKVAPFDAAVEAAMSAPAATAVVTTVGHSRGEGVAILSAEK